VLTDAATTSDDGFMASLAPALPHGLLPQKSTRPDARSPTAPPSLDSRGGRFGKLIASPARFRAVREERITESRSFAFEFDLQGVGNYSGRCNDCLSAL